MNRRTTYALAIPAIALTVALLRYRARHARPLRFWDEAEQQRRDLEQGA